VKALVLLTILCAASATAMDRRQSAALFVGIQQFTRDTSIADVRYAVDDAIDLAYVFTFDSRVSLVTPHAVVLALSGQARKAESRQRLAMLVAAGATVATAGRDDVLTLLRSQADRAGRDGMLIVAIASHGFSREGAAYVLAATSIAHEPETALAADAILDIAAASKASRALIFLDACRERAVPARGEPDALADAMMRAEGQVVLYAAAAGKYGYDDEQRKNGVFTGAVIDALQCKDVHGLITADQLSRSVDKRVRAWSELHRDPLTGRGIQVRMDHEARAIPLALCSQQ
jgi:hypothetical protein